MEWGNLLSTLVGGLISLGAALSAIFLTEWLREKQRRREILLDAAAGFYAGSQRAAIQMSLYLQEKDDARRQEIRTRYEEYDIEVKRSKFKLATLLAARKPELRRRLEELYALYRNCQSSGAVKEFVDHLESYCERFQQEFPMPS